MKLSSNHRPASEVSRSGGFTIVEIVVAFIIIGILTAVLVPTLASRSQDAKIAAVKSDLQHLVDAQERVAIDIGAAIRPYALNDVRDGNGVANSAPGDTIDGLADEFLTSTVDPRYLLPENLFISINNQNYLPNLAQQSLFDKLVPVRGGTPAPQDETIFNAQVVWRGPYVQWSQDANRNGWPDDPWGNDYLFFSKLGVLIPVDHTSLDTDMQTDRSHTFQPTVTINGDTYNAQFRFDRFTFLSLGPNGLPGDGSGSPDAFGTGDDIYRQFGGTR